MQITHQRIKGLLKGVNVAECERGEKFCVLKVTPQVSNKIVTSKHEARIVVVRSHSSVMHIA